MAAARELVIGDDPAAWEALGFAVGEDGTFALGGVLVRVAGRGAGVALRIEGLRCERPDALPIMAAGDDGPVVTAGDHGPVGDASSGSIAAPHSNGAASIDHVVVFTDDRDRTAAALAAAGGDVRRRGGPPELPVPMAFVRFGELVVEVAQVGGRPRIWGVTIVVRDVDALAGPPLGEARPAVQPGRRIATVSRNAGLSLAARPARPSSPPRSSGSPAAATEATARRSTRR